MIDRLRLAARQLEYGWSSYRDRLRRLLRCLLYHLRGRYEWRLSLLDYFIHIILLSLDLLLVGEWLIVLQLIFKRNCRGLTSEEVSILSSIYGYQAAYDVVVVDSKAVVMTRKYAFAYVSWHMINYWQRLSSAVLVHEYMHVLQYRQMGSVYIYEALKAQRSAAGYNYGGSTSLYQSMMMGGQLADFNLEQQAEIMEDCYRRLQRDGGLSTEYVFFMEQVGDGWV